MADVTVKVVPDVFTDVACSLCGCKRLACSSGAPTVRSGVDCPDPTHDVMRVTKPVDLDALDAAHADSTPGEWSASIPFPKFDDAGGHVFSDFNEISSVCSAYRAVNAHSIATLHNAYPAMAAELRERRAREEAMAAELRALREVAEAARAFVPTCEETRCGDGRCVECGEPGGGRKEALMHPLQRKAAARLTPR